MDRMINYKIHDILRLNNRSPQRYDIRMHDDICDEIYILNVEEK